MTPPPDIAFTELLERGWTDRERAIVEALQLSDGWATICGWLVDALEDDTVDIEEVLVYMFLVGTNYGRTCREADDLEKLFGKDQ